ncbi:ThuA domain-containing protein [Cytophagaceae bacterium DM2B3-1]|uniref:ThuA domain-containing protein n=1 Tax=Xanthocytophaga flava TaxID=3048013 RepID=A0ABT7CER3_9BACT|nr:ThuA domain-containing protein [Xanthocytophaga flavus]MDJ1492190.1 ThuA domain-containing protein [Xanthocytophaga flavus]
MLTKKHFSFLIIFCLAICFVPAFAQSSRIRALIVDGQNNHEQWPKITAMMKQYLEQTGKFSVDVQRTQFTWQGDKYIEAYPIKGLRQTQALAQSKVDSTFYPEFSKYDLVICNFGWNAAPWTAKTQADFEKYMKNGGGLVVIHAADNSFPEWPAYNQMIGLGGWGDRTEKDGPYVYYDQNDKLVKDTQPGKAGSHGSQFDFLITLRDTTHPITKGMPKKWLHNKDELYDRLRGPAKNMQILATAFSPKSNNGTDRNEPALITIRFGKGRIFHMTLGHADYSAECVGFITCLQRGSQWAATGKVDIPLPDDFPTETEKRQRKFDK